MIAFAIPKVDFEIIGNELKLSKIGTYSNEDASLD